MPFEYMNRKIYAITEKGVPDFSCAFTEIPGSTEPNLSNKELDEPYNDFDLIVYGAYIGSLTTLDSLRKIYEQDDISLHYLLSKMNHKEFGNFTMMTKAEQFAEEAYNHRAIDDMCKGEIGHFNRIVRTVVDSIDHQDAKHREVSVVIKGRKKISS